MPPEALTVMLPSLPPLQLTLFEVTVLIVTAVGWVRVTGLPL